MFEKLLNSAYEGGNEVFILMRGFNNPLRGRVQNIEGDYFSFFQNGKHGTVLWAFRQRDILSCGLLLGLPSHDLLETVESLEAEGSFLNESEN